MTAALKNRFSIRPLYLQVYDLLLERITSSVWAPGAPLPNEIELAQELGVSIGTVRKALEEMEGKHIIVRRQGRGTFVSDQNSSEMSVRFTNIRDEQGLRVKGEIAIKAVTQSVAGEIEQRMLDLPPAAAILSVLRVRTHRGHIFMWEKAVLPLTLFPDTTVDNLPDTVGELAQQHGILLTHAVEKIGPALASREAADALGVPEGLALLELDRVISTVDGRPAEWRVGLCHLREERYAVALN